MTRTMDNTDIAAESSSLRTAGDNKPHSKKEEPQFVPIRKKDLPTFHRQFVQAHAEPLLLEIDKPLVFPSITDLVSFFEHNDLLWRLGPLAAPSAYFALHDMQPKERLANLAFTYFSAYPAVGSVQALAFWDFVRRAAAKAGLSRIQSFVLSSSKKLPLIESFGFKKEGMLREHVFYSGRYHDVVVHAWMEKGRGG